MRYMIVLLSLVALSATADAPVAKLRYKCDGDKLYVEVAASRKGVFVFEMPAAVCGPSV